MESPKNRHEQLEVCGKFSTNSLEFRVWLLEGRFDDYFNFVMSPQELSKISADAFSF